jgi:hypothetical protein
MYCLSCNPRFFALDAQWSGLEREWTADRPPLIVNAYSVGTVKRRSPH